jgi:DNA mismatch endonuclease (patch repair protein)
MERTRDRTRPLSRSEVMSRIRSRDTKPEMAVRSAAHRLGFRFRLHRRDLPGTPDLTFAGRRKVVFVHGCFWHQHHACTAGRFPKTNQAFWKEKLARTAERDASAVANLNGAGWGVLIVWECETRDADHLAARLRSFLGETAT